MFRTAVILLIAFGQLLAQQGAGQEERILERGEKLLEEAKTSYEDARSKNSVAGFVDAGFKLEEARIKFIVLQEIGSADKQKIAVDRLRAINQLSKLIHDGKVAITGTPADSPSPKPSDAPSDSPKLDPLKKEPSPEPASPAAKAPRDVTKRAPIPDAAKQREAEKLIKDLFKDQYAKKGSSDRQSLAKSLLSQAEKSSDDLVAAWVLCREAQDAAVQACDAKTAGAAIEAAARIFDIDALPLKSAAFMAAGKNARSPGELSALGESLLELVEELINADQYETADKAATAALQHARRANDTALVVRATTCSKEVAEAKAKFQGMKNALVTLANSPDDPGANSQMGQFLCFVKGNWDLGLRFVAKGSDAMLKSLAEKELAYPPSAADRASLADGWYDLSEKEKSLLCKRQLLTHARTIYEGALSEATGLIRAKILRRLDAMRPTPAGEDLLKLIDPRRDARNGTWKVQEGVLIADGTSVSNHMRLDVPHPLPGEYDLTVVVEREGNAVGDFFVVLAGGGRPFAFTIDGFGGTAGGICSIDQQTPNEGTGKIPGGFFKSGVTRTLTYSVRKTTFSVQADGKEIYNFTGGWNRVSLHPAFGGDTGRLGLGTFSAVYRIKRLALATVSK